MAHRQPVAGHRQAHHELRGVVAAVLRLAAPAQHATATTVLGRTLLRFVLVIDLEVQRGGVVEDQLHIRIQQIRHAVVDRLFDRPVVIRQEIHGPIQVVQLQRFGAGDLHVLAKPLFVAIQLRGRGAGPVGHHGEQGALDGKVELALTDHVSNDLVDAEMPPDRLQHIDIAIGPRIEEPPVRLRSDDVLGAAAPQDAVGEAFEPFGDGRIVGASAVVDDPGLGTFLFGVPDVLGDLEVGEGGAVGAFLSGQSQVHVPDYTPVGPRKSIVLCQSMYLCISGSEPNFRRITP